MNFVIRLIAILIVAGIAYLAFPRIVSLPTDAATPVSFNHSAVAQEDALPFPVTIRRNPATPCVATGLLDRSGKPITISCSTCHATRKPNIQNRTAADLDEFHGGLTFAHGNLSCLACHNESDYDTLKLSDGTAVEYANMMQLCAQCHGAEMNDYEHGAHGGMSGYWDLTRGPRTRNGCTDCHDPHAPQFPHMIPTFKPKDRFLEQGGATSHE